MEAFFRQAGQLLAVLFPLVLSAEDVIGPVESPGKVERSILLEDTVNIGETSVLPSLENRVASERAVNLSLGFSYESLYVVRGKQAGGKSVQGFAAMSYAGFSFGVWGNAPLQPSNDPPDASEIDFSLTYSIELTDWLQASFGGTMEYYPTNAADPGIAWGASGSLEMDAAPGDPTFLYQYKFQFERHEFYLILTEEISLELILGWEGPFVFLGANFGYSTQSNSQYAAANDVAWAMGQFTVGTYFFDDQLRVDIGPHLATNNDGAVNNIGGRESNVWFTLTALWSF